MSKTLITLSTISVVMVVGLFFATKQNTNQNALQADINNHVCENMNNNSTHEMCGMHNKVKVELEHFVENLDEQIRYDMIYNPEEKNNEE